MEEERLNADALSGRQLSVALMVGGLSPAAALAGRGGWAWLLLWAAAGAALGWLLLRRVRRQPLFQGAWGGALAVLYGAWAVVLAARVLRRAAERVEFTSGGGQTRFWLVLLLALPLLWMSWGKAAPFFRAAEIFWLVMVVALALVGVLGLTRVEWRHVSAVNGGWRDAALVMGETMAPGLFVLPYIYTVKGEGSGGRGLVWLAGMGGVCVGLNVITLGILGAAVTWVEQPFFAAAGLLGNSARCEGLLSVLWLLPDLVLAGLLCRVWGGGKRPAGAACLSVLLAFSGITDAIGSEICLLGALVLALLTLLFPRGKGKIVVRF